ncbi:MAG TPA: hypothetical protein PKA61_07545 [Nitrospira sp.]|nr:hypothetical protein [Nitrospira sp.]
MAAKKLRRNRLWSVNLTVLSTNKKAMVLVKEHLDVFLAGLIGIDGKQVKSVLEEVKPDFSRVKV